MPNPASPPEDVAQIRVLAADRTRMNTQLLVEALARDKGLTLIEAEPTSNSVISTAAKEKPDVVVLSSELEEDASLGFATARQLRTALPETRIVILLDASDRDPVLEAFRVGARGIFSRAESLKSLAKCIHCVHAGQVWANSRELSFLADGVSESTNLRFAAAEGKPRLSKREQDVVRCVVDGLSNRETAARLSLTEHTVKNYLLRIFDKLGVSNRVGVVLYAFSLGQTPSALNHATHDLPPRPRPPQRGHK